MAQSFDQNDLLDQLPGLHGRRAFPVRLVAVIVAVVLGLVTGSFLLWRHFAHTPISIPFLSSIPNPESVTLDQAQAAYQQLRNSNANPYTMTDPADLRAFAITKKVSSIDEANDLIQMLRVESMLVVLAEYFQEKNAYPASLEGLQAELPSFVATCATKANCRLDPSFTTLAIDDVFTKQPYAYQLTSSGFNLVYTIRKCTSVGCHPNLDDTVVGKNTMTNTSMSVEKGNTMPDISNTNASNANASTNTNSSPTQDRSCISGTNFSVQDSDRDGLTDADEINLYHTDPCKADTDGDGFSDGTEVSKGYDPNGPGKLPAIAPNPKPVISDIQVVSTTTSTIFTWSTDVPANGLVFFNQGPALRPGDENTYSSRSTIETILRTSHSSEASMQAKGRTFHYFIRSCSNEGTWCTDSADASFVAG